MASDKKETQVQPPVVDSTSETGVVKSSADGPADFETAIAATGYGRFNYLLLLVGLPCCLSSQFDTTSLAYVIAVAECDMGLDFSDKGNLFGATYVGMISSAFFWGYLSDTFGRKRILVYGYLLDAVCNVMVTVSTTANTMMVFKFLSGFIISGPFAVLMTYLSELHGIQHRSRVMFAIGICFSIGNITLPLIAWAILPNKTTFILIKGFLELHSWQLFLAACSVPPLLAGLLVIPLPESPKFLMSQGRTKEALGGLKRIFAFNSGLSPDSYPIKAVINESQQSEGKRFSLKESVLQFAQVFRKPHLHNSILVYAIQFALLFGLNSLRLWVPQLFNIIVEYQNDVESLQARPDADLCNMIEHKINKTFLQMEEADSFSEKPCETVVNYQVYVNTLLLGFIQMGGYLVAGSLVNTLGNKQILIIGAMASGACGMALYLAKDSIATLLLSSFYVTISSICSTCLVTVTVVLFPTYLRTFMVSMVMMVGRIGAIFGNILFPLLLNMGCFPPFAMVGGCTMAASLICFFVPNTKGKPLT